MFTAVFFVSIGMLLDPKLLMQFAGPIVLISLVTLLGKVASCFFATVLTGYEASTALRVGLGLAQIGECSFIIARLGETTGVTSPFLYPIAVSVSGITTLTTPLLMTHTDRIVEWFIRWAPEPLITAGSLYRAWLERIKLMTTQTEQRQAIWMGLRTQGFRLLLYGAMTLAIAFIAWSFAGRVAMPPLVYWAIAGLVMFPFLFGVAYSIDRMVWDVIVLNLVQWSESTPRERVVHGVLHNMVRFSMVLLMGVPLVALSTLFVPFVSFVVGIAALTGVSLLVFWESARRVHESFERTVLRIFDRTTLSDSPLIEREQDELREPRPTPLREASLARTQRVELSPGSPWIGRTFRALNLRWVSGAHVVGIKKRDRAITNPDADVVIEEGDHIVLFGLADPLELAKQYLDHPA